MPPSSLRTAARTGTLIGVLSAFGPSGAGLIVERAAAQNRETLETKVTARGNSVFLKWSKKHQWDADLLRGGALLFAEYRTRDGAVALDCLTPVDAPVAAPAGRRAVTPAAANCQGLRGEVDGKPDDRTLRFRLPETTTGTPAGSVCLFFRLPSQRLLPIRRASKQRDETARFRHAAWEEEARRQADGVGLRHRVELLRRAVEMRARDVAAQEALNQRNGWTSAEACQAVQPPELAQGKPERPLAEPAEQEEIARRVCVMRVWYADSVLSELPLEKLLGVGAVHEPDVVDQLFGMLPRATGPEPADVAARRRQAGEYRRDWNRLAPQIRAYRDALVREGQQPHFGSFTDYLPLQTLTAASGRNVAVALSRQERPAPPEVLGLIGGMVEAYGRCVSDGQAQLATTYRNTTELRSRTPALRESVRQALIKTCNGGLEKLAGLRAEHAELLEELAAAERELEQGGKPAATADRLQELNGAACRP